MSYQTLLMKPQAELLFDEYKKVRNIDLTLAQFTYLLNLYPSLIVCMSDGVLDKEEWEGVDKLAKGLTLNFSDDLSSEETSRMEQKFRTEFMYLLENIEKWQKKFLNALKSHIQDSKLDKEFVLESMYLFANAADGISDVEQDAIDMLADRLALNH